MPSTTVIRFQLLLFFFVTRSQSFSPAVPNIQVLRVPQQLQQKQQNTLQQKQIRNHTKNIVNLNMVTMESSFTSDSKILSNDGFSTELTFTTNPKLSSSLFVSDNIENKHKMESKEVTDIIFIGRKSSLTNLYQEPESFLNDDTLSPLQQDGVMFLSSMIERLISGSHSSGESISSFLPICTDNPKGDKKIVCCSVISLPDKVSRNNHYMSPHKITDILPKVCPKQGNVKLYVISDNPTKDAGAISAAIARCFPTYSSKTSSSTNDDLFINTCFLNKQCQPSPLDDRILQSSKFASEGIRLASKLTDMPPNELTTNSYSLECQQIAESLGDCVVFEEIVGENLKENFMGGIYNVGKGADQEICPPRLIVMKYTPKDNESSNNDVESIALCGKGVIYDSGGLSLKTKAVSHVRCIH